MKARHVFEQLCACLLFAATVAAAANTFIYVPTSGGFPWNYNDPLDPPTNPGNWGSADQLNCLNFRSMYSVTNITQMGLVTGPTAPGSNQNIGFALYTNAGTQLFEKVFTQATWNAGTLYTSSLTTFSLAADTFYWYCWCSGADAGDLYSAGTSHVPATDIMNVSGTARFGKLTSGCSNGNPRDDLIVTLTAVGTEQISAPTVIFATATP